jgi:hypothetical protein
LIVGFSLYSTIFIPLSPLACLGAPSKILHKWAGWLLQGQQRTSPAIDPFVSRCVGTPGSSWHSLVVLTSAPARCRGQSGRRKEGSPYSSGLALIAEPQQERYVARTSEARRLRPHGASTLTAPVEQPTSRSGRTSRASASLPRSFRVPRSTPVMLSPTQNLPLFL